MVASINKITNEDVACLIDLSTFNQSKITCSKELKHVVELAMNISTYCDRAGDRLDIGLFQKDLFGLRRTDKYTIFNSLSLTFSYIKEINT